MAKTRIGLDIGSSGVRVAEVTQSDRPSVLRIAEVGLPDEAVEHGEVRRPDVVAEAIRRVMSAAGISEREVYTGIANPRVVVREVSLPWLPEKELRESLPFQAQDFIPMPIEQAVIDCSLAGEHDEEGRRMQRLLLVAAAREPLMAQLDAIVEADLVPVGVDVSAFAAVRATLAGGSDEGEVLVDVGEGLTTVTLHRGPQVRLVRILELGRSDVREAVAADLGVGEESLPDVLRRLSHEPDNLQELDRVREAALDGARPLVDEIASTIEFSVRQVDDLEVRRILLTGGQSQMAGLLDGLGARFGLPVDHARVVGRFKARVGKEHRAEVEMGRRFLVAIGLAMPDASPRRRQQEPASRAPRGRLRRRGGDHR